MTLRPYQRAAIDATFAYWEKEGGSPLLEMATGTGKSVVLATLIRELLATYPAMRVLCLVHVRELVQQNAEALLRSWPGAPVGINSAGLGRRDTQHPILFASIQSVHRHASRIGRRDLVLVDEAHLLPAHGEGMYHELFKELQFTTSPDLRLFGCTATPYRLDSGRLDRGKGRLFDRICYSYGIGEGVRDGYLSPLIAKSPGTEIDVSSVARRGGEFLPAALGAAADQSDVTQAAVREIVAHGVGRRSWLIFAASVAHAHHVRDEVRHHGVSCEVISGETPREERATLLRAFKSGQIRALANMSVLTTGFDAPQVDLIAMLRPTLSTGLYVQMLGRGTRLASGKENCLVLDFSGNVRRHGPVDEIEVREKKVGSGDRPSVTTSDVRSQVCATCLTHNSLGAATCTACGGQLRDPVVHAPVADTVPIMSGFASGDWQPVKDVAFTRHTKMGGGHATLRVEYVCGRRSYSEFLCFDHPEGSFPHRKAQRWWRDRGGDSPPHTLDDALARTDELAPVGSIRVVKDGDYWRVVSIRDRGREAA